MIRLLAPAKSLHCQLCGGGDLVRFEIPGSSVLWRCDACELYQFGQLVDQEAYEADYHSGYERRRASKVRTAKVRLGRLLPSVKQMMKSLAGRPPALLEISSSVGCTLEAAEAFGWKATGVDVSEDTVRLCQDRGLDCHHVGPLKLPFEDQSFDIIASWHVIEHVGDVRETLGEWLRVLRPGGIMMIETPDASSPKVRRLGQRYRKFWAPEHTYTFTPDNLAAFVTECGFEVMKVPRVAAVHRPNPSDALYATLYQSYHSARALAGIHKAFQLVARRPLACESALAANLATVS